MNIASNDEHASYALSLDQFFYENESDITLNNCDREPIHVPGTIQNHGVLFILQPGTQQIVSVSDNVSKLLGIEDELVGRSFGSVFPELTDMLQLDSINRSVHSHISPGYVLETDAGSFNPIFHHHHGYDVVEFLREHPLSIGGIRKQLRTYREESANILGAPDFQEALNCTVQAAKALTRFSRVILYQFLPDWSGHVIAEAKDADTQGFLNHRFPDTDIPKQARYIMQMIPFRSIASVDDDISRLVPVYDADGQPFDLTWSLLRSASVMHTEYLRNMYVRATFTVSLIYKGQLWGILACHNDSSGYLPFDTCNIVRDLCTSLMSRYAQEEKVLYIQKIAAIKDVETDVATLMMRRANIKNALVNFMPRLKDLMQADGFAFVYGDEHVTNGDVPPLPFIRNLIEWAEQQENDTDYFSSTSLHAQWPEALKHIDTACGVLIEPVKLSRASHLLWFRAPVVREITWAGNPDKKFGPPSPDEPESLTPRLSFASWKKEHNDKSREWSSAEIAASREVMQNLLDIISAQIVLVERENEDLRLFSYAVAHDVRSPINKIQYALDAILDEEETDQEFIADIVSRARRSSEGLLGLLDQLLVYLVMRKKEPVLSTVDLNAVLRSVQEEEADLLANAGGTLNVISLPTIKGDQDMLYMLFDNLVGNAIKYRDLDEQLIVQVTAKKTDKGHVVSVTDNGPGIPAEFAERIFKPLKRLHNERKVPGNGLGLALCKGIVELHNGSIYLDTTYTQGARFCIHFHDSEYIAL